ncbi:MAG: starch-binding protein [Ruminococcaceae bacterium]|nr:starch-binding protein [Oscillospiraceae bacterium]MBE6824856.1 starch-binding protein [Oscillospiraceae bacterium]
MVSKKHTTKSAICMLLTVAMLISMMFCTTVQFSAENVEVAETGASGTVYYENSTNWGSVYCYMWNGSGDSKNAEWPGVQMTNVSGSVWKYNTTTDYQNIIFNNGTGGNGNQTADLTFPGDGQIYRNGSWGAYEGHVVTPTTANPTTAPTPTTETPTQGGGSTTDSKMVYCKNSAGWGAVSCYMWKDGAGENASWPGKTMTNIGDDVWQYEVTGNWDKIIFSNSGSNQTGDMSFPGAGRIYDNKSGTWEIYDVSPITVSSFTSDLASPQYKGTEIVVSANAKSTGGTVSYKFSVANASNQTTVISEYSAKNTVTWVPTVAGTYTLICDLKDTSGNENQRKLTYTVSDDSSVVAPIIKKITAGNNGQMKKGVEQTITVTAGGGKVGTNLLFYKYTVKNQQGMVVNVPYYTTNSTYKFTPTTLGTYTVVVSVQASDNGLLERQRSYECVNEIVDNTEPTQPTQPTQPVIPTEPSTSGSTDVFTMKGDANADGKVTIIDATHIQRYLVELVNKNDINIANSDINGNDKVEIIDATHIQRKLAELEVW